MKRIRLLGLALIAIFALGAFASASAFAENPEILPVPSAGKPAAFTSTAGIAILLTTKGTKIECKEATDKGQFESQDLGTVEIDFHFCKGTINGKTSPCNSPGKEKELILTEGDIHLVDVLPTGTLDLGVWIEPHEHNNSTEMLHFECGVTKSVILGSVIGVVDNFLGALLKDLENFNEVKALWKESKTLSEQEIKECMLLKAFCEKKVFQLEIELGSGHELFALIADDTLLFTKTWEIHF